MGEGTPGLTCVTDSDPLPGCMFTHLKSFSSKIIEHNVLIYLAKLPASDSFPLQPGATSAVPFGNQCWNEAGSLDFAVEKNFVNCQYETVEVY